MFVFLTTVRHPKTAKNYNAILDILSLTINSVSNQKTNFEYKFIVVCNELPELQVNFDNVIFHVVDFPPPGGGVSNKQTLTDMSRDKGTKLAAGLIFAKKLNPKKVFIIDADDWVRDNVVEYVMSNANNDFWHVNKGYVVNLNEKSYVRKYGLSRYCGTSYIYDYSKLIKLLSLDIIEESPSLSSLIEGVEEFQLLNILGNHRYQFSHFKKYGYEFKELPFFSICWVVNNGENHSGKTGEAVGLPLNNNIVEQFGLKNKNIGVERAASLSERSQECLARLISLFGWIRTNKNAFKV